MPAEGPSDGVIIAHGGHAGGYALYLQGHRLRYVYNYLGSEVTTISANIELLTGPSIARMTFTRTGDLAGDVALFYDDVPVGEGSVPHTAMLTCGTTGFAVGYQPGGPISPNLGGRFAIPEGVLGKVVVEAEPRQPSSSQGPERRADLATQ